MEIRIHSEAVKEEEVETKAESKMRDSSNSTCRKTARMIHGKSVNLMDATRDAKIANPMGLYQGKQVLLEVYILGKLKKVWQTLHKARPNIAFFFELVSNWYSKHNWIIGFFRIGNESQIYKLSQKVMIDPTVDPNSANSLRIYHCEEMFPAVFGTDSQWDLNPIGFL